MMNVAEIVIQYLKDNGFDGLCGGGCGCGLDDLQPCAEDFSDCKPGYKTIANCPECDSENFCDGATGEICYRTEKPAVTKEQ